MINTATNNGEHKNGVINDPGVNYRKNESPLDIKKRIENHRISADYLQKAVKHYTDAAKHLETGDHVKAVDSANKAQDCIRQAAIAQDRNEKNNPVYDDIRW